MVNVNKLMKKGLFFIGVVAVTILICCLTDRTRENEGSFYRQGYEAGYKGLAKPTHYYFSDEYQQGYKEGKLNAFDFKFGCSDKHLGNDPQYPKKKWYMKGYNYCTFVHTGDK